MCVHDDVIGSDHKMIEVKISVLEKVVVPEELKIVECFAKRKDMSFEKEGDILDAVSYTHLTLPTKA